MSFDIVAVTNDTIFQTLGVHRSTFSLLDALFPGYASEFADLSYNGSSYLFKDACRLGDETQNCTASCSSNGTMFANLQNLHNCVTYQNVANQYLIHNLTKEAQALVESLKIEPANPDSTLVNNITQDIGTCLVDYCSSIPGCATGYPGYLQSVPQSDRNHTSPYEPGNDFDLYTDGKYLVDAICGSLPLQINPDIGGIGIYISYWIQTGLALLGFLTTMLYDSWVYYGSVIVLAIPYGFRRASEKARMIQLQNKEHLCRLIVALTDFQKAQSIFMSAINIAALVVTHRGGFDPQSIDQLSLTYIFTEIIALGGLIPVTFTLFTLHLVDMCSWYLLFLSSVSIALSTATLVTISHFNPNEHTLEELSSYASSDGPPSCNSWRPGAYCYTSAGLTPSLFNDDAWTALGFCLVVLVLLMIKQSKILTSRPAQHCLSWTSKKLAPCLPVLTVPARCIHRAIYLIRRRFGHRAGLLEPFDPDTDYPMIIGRIFIAMLYVLFTGLYIFGFYVFCSLLAVFAQVHWLSTSWSFGQVLAIMVWAQPLCEYVHLEFRGMERGMDHSTMPPYRLIKDEENVKVVGGDSDEDTQLGDYPLNQRKSSSGNITPAEGYPHYQKTGLNKIDSLGITPVQRESTWPTSGTQRDNTDHTRLMS